MSTYELPTKYMWPLLKHIPLNSCFFSLPYISLHRYMLSLFFFSDYKISIGLLIDSLTNRIFLIYQRVIHWKKKTLVQRSVWRKKIYNTGTRVLAYASCIKQLPEKKNIRKFYLCITDFKIKLSNPFSKGMSRVKECARFSSDATPTFDD